MIVDILVAVLGSAIVMAGLIGCIVPVIPGPPVAYLALLLVSWAGGWNVYALWVLIVMAAAAVGAAVLDSILPIVTSRRSGAGKAGIWGSVLGMLVGTVFFPPFGTVIGAFLGALAGELLVMRKGGNPMKAALGVFTGTMLAAVVKLSVSGVAAVLFVRGLIQLF
ncbi:MAG: DUF456 domain-containing protein [Spirochaetia bacterium]|nr:DUF456 domain-containing protein [Spirochaetia bacterium]